MNLEQQIAELLAAAEPLRSLPADEAEARGLPAIVDSINALRAMQAREPVQAPAAWPVLEAPVAAVEGADASDGVDGLHPVVQAEPVKRKPGRPRKAD